MTEQIVPLHPYIVKAYGPNDDPLSPHPGPLISETHHRTAASVHLQVESFRARMESDEIGTFELIVHRPGRRPGRWEILASCFDERFWEKNYPVVKIGPPPQG
jgi:hypothetical protein